MWKIYAIKPTLLLRDQTRRTRLKNQNHLSLVMDKGCWVPTCPHMGWNLEGRNQSRTVPCAYPELAETGGSWQSTAAALCWRSAANLPSTEVKCFCPSSSLILQQQWELKCTSKEELCGMGDEIESSKAGCTGQELDSILRIAFLIWLNWKVFYL